jgi:hypothetical protein
MDDLFEFYIQDGKAKPTDFFSPENIRDVGPSDLYRTATKSDLERSWKDFVCWIGYSELVNSLNKKILSIDHTSLRLIAQSIFSIEIGLSNIIKRWSTLRRLSYPSDICIYNAYSFIQSCTLLKRSLTSEDADQLKRRIISCLLPSGRLADFDLELRIWQTLSRSPENTIRHGFLGAPGADFIVNAQGIEVEIEAKCISPEIGTPLSYAMVSSLLRDVHKSLKKKYPGFFVVIEAEVTKTHPTSNSAPAFKAQIEKTYDSGESIVSPDLKTTISFRSIDEIAAEIGHADGDFSHLFGKYRRQYGDFGLFTGNETECVFLNLIPLSKPKTLKKMMRIISEAGDQFSKMRPSILWLDLLGLPEAQNKSDDEDMLNFFDRLLDHAFRPRRDHISIVVLSSDNRMITRKTFGKSKSFRAADSTRHKRFYANPNAKFPLGKAASNKADLANPFSRSQDG